MISYRKLLEICEAQHVNSYVLKKHKVIGQASWQKLQSGSSATGNVDMKTIDALCKFLKCQPGDLIEYVEEPEQGASEE